MHTYSKRELKNTGPFRRPGIEEYVKKWSTPNDKPLLDGFVAEVLENQGFEIIRDPRNIYDPEQLYEALERYSPENDKFIKMTPSIRRGIDMAYKMYSRPKDAAPLKSLSHPMELLQTVKGSKSAGATAIGQKKADVSMYALNRMNKILMGDKAPNPCLAYARTGADNRTRLVWGYPYEMTLMEAQFARPLIDKAFTQVRTNMAIKMSKVVLGQILDKQILNEGTPVGMDYSKFDSTICSFFIKTAFNILSTWFTDEDKERYGWKTIISYFLHTPIVMPNGNLYKGKKHGVPSGSYFTQLIDSIVNTIALGAIFAEFGQPISMYRTLVLGDDSIFAWKGNIRKKMPAIVIYAKQELGLIINAKKTVIGQAHFLGATWINGLPHAEERVIAAKMVNPESFRKYSKEKDASDQAEAVVVSFMSAYIEAARFMPPANRSIYSRRLAMSPGIPGQLATGLQRFRQLEAELQGLSGPLGMDATKIGSHIGLLILK